MPRTPGLVKVDARTVDSLFVDARTGRHWGRLEMDVGGWVCCIAGARNSGSRVGTAASGAMGWPGRSCPLVGVCGGLAGTWGSGSGPRGTGWGGQWGRKVVASRQALWRGQSPTPLPFAFACPSGRFGLSFAAVSHAVDAVLPQPPPPAPPAVTIPAVLQPVSQEGPPSGGAPAGNRSLDVGRGRVCLGRPKMCRRGPELGGRVAGSWMRPWTASFPGSLAGTEGSAALGP